MWSGPRNISTAMMRAWGSRADTQVVDEPFYAHYLLHTPHRDDHPGADEIIASYITDPHSLTTWLSHNDASDKPIFYQKHMTHHMLDSIPLDWLTRVSSAFLIRDPRAVIASFSKVIPNPDIDQIGLPGQIRIFNHVHELTGVIPPVIDAADVLREPRATLTRLCQALGVPFDPAMLTWERGSRLTDGIWAKHWYAAVEASTGFAPYQPKHDPIPEHLHALADECDALYKTMYAHRLT